MPMFKPKRLTNNLLPLAYFVWMLATIEGGVERCLAVGLCIILAFCWAVYVGLIPAIDRSPIADHSFNKDTKNLIVAMFLGGAICLLLACFIKLGAAAGFVVAGINGILFSFGIFFFAVIDPPPSSSPTRRSKNQDA